MAIYSHVFGVSGQCKSVGLKFSDKLDFSSCAIWDVFCISSHVATYMISLDVVSSYNHIQPSLHNYFLICDGQS